MMRKKHYQMKKKIGRVKERMKKNLLLLRLLKMNKAKFLKISSNIKIKFQI